MKPRRQPTCAAVFVFLTSSARPCGLLVVVAGPLVQPGVAARTAIAKLALSAAYNCILTIEALRALETVTPRALRVVPAVTILASGLHLHDRQQESRDHGERHQGACSEHKRTSPSGLAA